MRIGIIHLTQRIDSWSNYYAWELRRRGHEVVWCAEFIGPFPDYQWRPPDCDFYLQIDDSRSYETPSIYRPLIYLCSDTHVPDGVDRGVIAGNADFTFVCQVNGGEVLVASMTEPKPMAWMPHAAWFFPERAKEMKFDVCSHMVLGQTDHPIFGERSQLCHRIVDELCQRVPDRSGNKVYRVRIRSGIFHHEMADNYAVSRIVWHHSVGNDLAMRIFEGAACGACVVSNRIKDNGMEEIFGDLIPQYDTADECINLIRSLLDKPKECEERGRELRKLVEGQHRYVDRVDRVLDKAKEWMR